MKKLFAFIVILILALVISALYGIIHDQFTYTISPEYYTKFKFVQFGLVEDGYQTNISHPRLWVCYVGIMATWWMGLPIGLILGITALMCRSWKEMLIYSLKSFFLATCITFIIGLVGLIYGFYQASNNLKSFTHGWFLPVRLADKNSFVAVGSMHNFSYIGGLLGIIIAIVYLVRKNGSKIIIPRFWKA